MKGKRRFSRYEAQHIRELLVTLREEERNIQKRLRGQLRKKYGFYISDFEGSGRGFSRSDFDALVSDGVIEIDG